MKYYVYKFLNKDGDIIYIGKTQKLKNRMMQQHFTLNSHLYSGVYFQTEKVMAAELISHEEMDIYERYLINIHSPRHNTRMKNNDAFSFELPALNWEEIPFSTSKMEKQLMREIEKAMIETSPISQSEIEQMEDSDANIQTERDEVNKFGYIHIQKNNTSILSLRLKRNRDKYSSGHRLRLDKNPYCRYIVVNNERYFCIEDIEYAVGTASDISTYTRAMIKKGIIDSREIIALEDETLKDRLHAGGGQLRFGSGIWLKHRVLSQVEINRRSGRFRSHKSGWTDELKYLAEELVSGERVSSAA